MSAPSIIYFHSDGPNEDWAALSYTYRNQTNTSSGPQTYRLHNTAGNPQGNGSEYNITIDFQSNKYVCADAGFNAPHRLYVGDGSAPSSVPTTTTVDLINTTDYLYIFQSSTDSTKYSILDLNGPGGGTSTEGSSYSGTLTVNGTSLEYEIPATSSSGTYELKADGTTQLSIVHGSTASTGSAPNFDQTKIWTLISPMGDELDEIDLTGSGGSFTKKSVL